jgi:thymidylate synthase (FAD)
MTSYGRTVQDLISLADKGITKVEARKWARGKARQLLPHALETRVMMTGNLRSWREILIKRTSRHAEPEIRRLAEKLWLELHDECPAAFDGLLVGQAGDASRGEKFIELLEPK